MFGILSFLTPLPYLGIYYRFKISVQTILPTRLFGAICLLMFAQFSSLYVYLDYMFIWHSRVGRCHRYIYASAMKKYSNFCSYFQVKTWKMNLFTFIQIAGLGILWAVKSSPAALAFPFFVVAMVPLRMLLAKLPGPLKYSEAELEAVSS